MILEIRPKFRIVDVDVDVVNHEYGWGLGDGAQIIKSWGLTDVSNSEPFDSLQDVVEAIHEYYPAFSDDLADYRYSEYDGVISTDALVAINSLDSRNDDIRVPTAAEVQQWKNGDLTLYSATIYIWLIVEEEHYINGEFDSKCVNELTEEYAKDAGLYIID